VIRRMPLSPGYKTALQEVMPSATALKVGLTVTGMEDVTTKAGTFHCYKVELDSRNQTFYISADAARYPVKVDISGIATLELESIGRVGTQPGTTYRDEKTGYTVALPAGWNIDVVDHLGGKDGSMVQLENQDSLAVITIWAYPQEVGASLPASAAARRKSVEQSILDLQNLKVRADEWRDRQVGGHPAVSWVADTKDPFNQKIVQYRVRVWSPKWRVDITAKAKPQELDGLRPRLDSIIDSIALQ
jgi:hypothetical protein